MTNPNNETVFLGDTTMFDANAIAESVGAVVSDLQRSTKDLCLTGLRMSINVARNGRAVVRATANVFLSRMDDVSPRKHQ